MHDEPLDEAIMPVSKIFFNVRFSMCALIVAMRAASSAEWNTEAAQCCRLNPTTMAKSFKNDRCGPNGRLTRHMKLYNNIHVQLFKLSCR
jgi:hypothetical protein